MRPLLPIMSQWMNHSWTFNNLEHSFFRYGQLLIYVVAISIIGFVYLEAQQVIAKFLEALQTPMVQQP